MGSVEGVKRVLDAQGIFARFVKTGGKAYHSHHMAPVAAAYERLIGQAKGFAPFDLPQPSKATMVSSVTGSKISHGTVIDEQYWSANLRSPVLFNQAVQTIATDGQFSDVDMLIEIGPHSALSGPIKQVCGAFGFDKLGYLPTLLRGTDSASQLLKVAGELFLRDYPLDMERVTAIEETLPKGKNELVKGSVLVNLPTYQWNYSKNLWVENRQSVEHRARQHARHHILGGRMPGGSKVEPMWRNMLRIRDVPWLQHHSLGGEAVFPTAGYFSMAIEAITQLNEDSPNPVTIESYVLRDISIKAALVTPDNDTGTEVLFSIRPSVYSEVDPQSTWWDFNVSSTSEVGHWSNHMTGIISINTRQRDLSPKRTPNLPQRASGTSWNQALREVSFDYGATFQDMTDVRSDGKTYAATAKTVVKQACGIIEGESRYVLHPGTVDSCLQLLIVSIYAGRQNDMTCGAVPIQVDEVAIWPPTAEQLNSNTADVYSWVDQRGIRSFVGGSQLVAANGELLMDITDMRCTSYEAAVPQPAEETAKVEPYGQMIWKYDIDSLKISSELGSLDISQLVDLAVHKNPAIKVLELGSKHAETILSKAKLLHYTGTEISDEGVEKMTLLASFQKVDPAQTLESQGIAEGSFDLIIVPVEVSNPGSSQNIQLFLAPGGRAIFELGEPSDVTLQAVGLADTDALVFDNQYNSSALVLSSPVTPFVNGEPQTTGVEHEAVLVHRKSPVKIVSEAEKALGKLGWSTRAISLDDCQGKVGDHIIMVADLEGPLLASLQDEELTAIRNLTTTASSILWVTGGGLLAGKLPEHGLTAGLARSITSEQASLDLTTLDFDLENTSSFDIVDTIAAAAQRQNTKVAIRETEYYVSHGQVYISRLVPNDDLNRAYSFDKKDSLEEFLTLPMAYGAAIYGLNNLASVAADDNVLILNGTGRAGIAAIQISQLANAKPFVAVDTAKEAEKLMRDFGLSKEQVLLPSKMSITSRLDALTGGHGADVVFSSGFVDAALARECWRRIAPFGRFVDSSRKNVLKRSALDTLPLHHGANYLSFDLLDLYRWRPQALAGLLRDISCLYRRRSISHIHPVTITNIAELDSAVSSYSNEFTAGKTLISYETSDTPINVLPTRMSLRFKPDATYLLVGCLGGLGRSLTSWMMEHGARRFAFLSRSGTDSEQAAILVDEIQAAGVAVQVIRGDAAVKADVERAVKSIPAQYPVRGVVQAAMVLKVSVLTALS